MNAAQASNSMQDNLRQRKYDVTRQCTSVAQQAGKPLLFGMTTALMLHAVPLPAKCNLNADKFHVIADNKQHRMNSLRGLVQPHVWTLLEQANTIQINRYVHVLDLFHTWAQMATHIPLQELVILGESIINNTGSCLQKLANISNGTHAFHGKKKCQTAIKLIIPGAQSPKESESHLTLRSHGIPRPVMNYQVPNALFKSGVPMTLDMAWPEFLVAIEYDGDQHRTDKIQWRRDQEKRNYLRSRRWEIISATASNLADEDSRAEFAFLAARTLVRRGAHFDFRVAAMSLEQLARYEQNRNRPKS